MNRGYCHDTESHSFFLARSISLTDLTTTSGFKELPNFMQLSQLEVEICNEIICRNYYCQCCRLNHTILSSSAHCRLDSMKKHPGSKSENNIWKSWKRNWNFWLICRERERERVNLCTLPASCLSFPTLLETCSTLSHWLATSILFIRSIHWQKIPHTKEINWKYAPRTKTENKWCLKFREDPASFSLPNKPGAQTHKYHSSCSPLCWGWGTCSPFSPSC